MSEFTEIKDTNIVDKTKLETTRAELEARADFKTIALNPNNVNYIYLHPNDSKRLIVHFREGEPMSFGCTSSKSRYEVLQMYKNLLEEVGN